MSLHNLEELTLPSYTDENALRVFNEYLHNDYESAEELLEGFEEHYAGEFNNRAEFAGDLLDNTGQLSELPQFAQVYFDYDAYGRDLILGGDYWEAEGYYFRNY